MNREVGWKLLQCQNTSQISVILILFRNEKPAQLILNNVMWRSSSLYINIFNYAYVYFSNGSLKYLVCSSSARLYTVNILTCLTQNILEINFTNKNYFRFELKLTFYQRLPGLVERKWLFFLKALTTSPNPKMILFRWQKHWTASQLPLTVILRGKIASRCLSAASTASLMSGARSVTLT